MEAHNALRNLGSVMSNRHRKCNEVSGVSRSADMDLPSQVDFRARTRDFSSNLARNDSFCFPFFFPFFFSKFV